MNQTRSPQTLGELVDAVAPSLVAIARGGRGSGVVLAPGRVLIGTHGVRAERLAVVRADGDVVPATLLAHDPDRTLALLATDTGDAAPIAWPDADPTPELGDGVIAVARPSGRPLHATRGEIAAVGERLRGPRGRLGDPGSSTPRRCRAALPAARCSTPTARCSASAPRGWTAGSCSRSRRRSRCGATSTISPRGGPVPSARSVWQLHIRARRGGYGAPSDCRTRRPPAAGRRRRVRRRGRRPRDAETSWSPRATRR